MVYRWTRRIFHNKNLNIDKLYLTDDDADNEIIINNLFNNLYDFYTNKLENDKSLDIGDYDIIIKEDITWQIMHFCYKTGYKK